MPVPSTTELKSAPKTRSGTHGTWKAAMYHDLRRCPRSDFHARERAAGWGVESTVTDATRSGWLPASSHATAPPQSWPTTWARSTPAASSSASTSASSSSRRYAARPGGRAPAE